MSKAAELAALIGSQSALSNRNLIINGAMQVAQRGTSSTGLTSGDNFLTDRFKTVITSLGTWTITQDSDAPDGFSKSLKIDCTTADASPAASDLLIIDHRIEAQDLQQLAYGTSAAKSITLSFYVKSNKTGNATVGILQPDSSFKMVSPQYTINSANTWERKEIVIAGDAAGQIDNNTDRGLEIEWWLNSGSNFTSGSHQNTYVAIDNTNRNPSNLGIGGSTDDYFQITGIQLEVGEQATPFEHRSFGDELRRCQRYYEHTYPYGTAPGTANGGIGADHRYVGRETANNYGYYTAHYRVEKRAAPTVTVYSYAGTANQIGNGDTGGDSGAVGVIQSGTTSFLPRNTSGSGVSARALMYHFKADAEL